jgi:hypothetical protein
LFEIFRYIFGLSFPLSHRQHLSYILFWRAYSI